MENQEQVPETSSSPAPRRMTEDWLAVIIAFLIMILCVAGVFGAHGMKIGF